MPGWWKLVDEGSGEFYYWHEETGDVQWDVPDDYVEDGGGDGGDDGNSNSNGEATKVGAIAQ
jgi:hypothetical protein